MVARAGCGAQTQVGATGTWFFLRLSNSPARAAPPPPVFTFASASHHCVWPMRSDAPCCGWSGVMSVAWLGATVRNRARRPGCSSLSTILSTKEAHWHHAFFWHHPPSPSPQLQLCCQRCHVRWLEWISVAQGWAVCVRCSPGFPRVHLDSLHHGCFCPAGWGTQVTQPPPPP